MTTAGELGELITIERSTTASDGMGGQTVTWTTNEQTWAKVRPVRGRETEHLGRLATVETYLFVIRYGSDVSTLDRVVWNSKTFNIRSVQDRDADRRWLTLECEAGLGT